MNDYEPRELVAIFERAGFRYVGGDRWQSQELYRFVTCGTAEVVKTQHRATVTCGDFVARGGLQSSNLIN